MRRLTLALCHSSRYGNRCLKSQPSQRFERKRQAFIERSPIVVEVLVPSEVIDQYGAFVVVEKLHLRSKMAQAFPS